MPATSATTIARDISAKIPIAAAAANEIARIVQGDASRRTSCRIQIVGRHRLQVGAAHGTQLRGPCRALVKCRGTGNLGNRRICRSF